MLRVKNYSFDFTQGLFHFSFRLENQNIFPGFRFEHLIFNQKSKVMRTYKYLPASLLLGACLLFTACSDGQLGSDLNEEERYSIQFTELAEGTSHAGHQHHTGGPEEGTVSEHLAAINTQLIENGFTTIELKKAETLTALDDGEFQTGQTIFANDRNKLLPAQWVPGDERRDAVGNTLTYLNFTPFMTANGSINGEPSIDASFDTWNSLKKNSGPELVKVPDTGVNPSAILTVGGLPGDPFLADISTMGFLPGAIFDLVLGPGTSTSVLGVAFTFTWTGTNEVALKEVWYNNDFAWSDDGTPGTIDIESVALHENGHALGFAHFGRIAVNNANGKLIVAPNAVMNASYLGPQRELLGTDKASFNSVYGSWPKN